MSAFASDRWRQTIYNAFHRVAAAWKVLAYGFDGSGHTPIRVDSDGHVQVDVLSGGGGGGGVQYTEGDVDASITGTAVMWEDAADTLVAASAAKPLPATVTGTVAVSSVAGNVACNTELPSAAALTDNMANPTAPAVAAHEMLWDGATWDRAPGTAADGALVNLGTNNDVTVTSGTVTANLAAGTNNIGDVDVLTLPAIPAGTNNIGDVDIASTPGAAVSTVTGAVDATTLSSDSTWTTLVSNTLTGHVLEIQNTSDAPLEIALKDSPTDTSGTDIATYIGPRSVKIIDFKAAGLTLSVDVEVRRFSTTPVAGSVFGTVYGV